MIKDILFIFVFLLCEISYEIKGTSIFTMKLLVFREESCMVVPFTCAEKGFVCPPNIV